MDPDCPCLNLTDNQEYLIRKGVITKEGTVYSAEVLLQHYLSANEDQIVKDLKAAELKAEQRRKANEAGATGDTPAS